MSDPETDSLRQRLRAVERAVTDDECPPAEVADAAEATGRIESLEERMDELEEQVAELDAATQALRGYVGNVRSVNETVRTRADSALSIARGLQSAPPGDGNPTGDDDRSPGDGPVAAETSADPPSAECSPHDSPDAASETGGDGWEGAVGPWEPAGERRSESRRQSSPDGPVPTAETDTDTETTVERTKPTGSTGSHGASSRWGRTDWPADRDDGTSAPDGSDRHPGETEGSTPGRGPEWDPESTASSGPNDGDEWPPQGMDVERAQPWSVPDPGEEEWNHEEDRTLLDRVREAL